MHRICGIEHPARPHEALRVQAAEALGTCAPRPRWPSAHDSRSSRAGWWTRRVIVAWTGHRPDIFGDPAAAEAAVHAVARELQPHARYFLVGGQRGVDTWAAQAAQAVGVPFSVVLPLAPDAFTVDWSAADRDALAATLADAEEVEVVGTFSARNRRLATGADLLVAVWTGTQGGGTAETLAFARQAGTRVREVRLGPAPGAASAYGRGI